MQQLVKAIFMPGEKLNFHHHWPITNAFELHSEPIQPYCSEQNAKHFLLKPETRWSFLPLMGENLIIFAFVTHA